MKGRSEKTLILGRLRHSKRLNRTQVLSQCAAMRGGTVQHQFLQAQMGGDLVLNIDNSYFIGMVKHIYPPELQLY